MNSLHLGRKRKVDLDSIIEEHDARESRQAETSKGVIRTAGRTRIGSVEQFYSKISVAGITLTGRLSAGDLIEIGTDDEAIRQRVSSMQIDGKNVEEAGEGDSVGIKLKHPVGIGSAVYRLD